MSIDPDTTVTVRVTVGVLRSIMDDTDERRHADFGGRRVCPCDACITYEWAERALQSLTAASA